MNEEERVVVRVRVRPDAGPPDARSTPVNVQTGWEPICQPP